MIHEGRESIIRVPVLQNQNKSCRGDHLQLGTSTRYKWVGDMIKNKSSGDLSSNEEIKRKLVDAKELQYVRLMVEKPVYVVTLLYDSGMQGVLTSVGVSQVLAIGRASICIYLCGVD